MRGVALILAAGRGARLGGGPPKGLRALAGRSPLAWSAQALGRARGVDGVLAVLPSDHLDDARDLCADWGGPARWLGGCAGGDSRQGSVACGMRALAGRAPDARWVLVHDAARCLVLPSDAERVLEAARSSGAALPVAPVTDTVKRIESGRVVETPPRQLLGLAQTPQSFRVELLADALRSAERDGFAGSDCASLVERLGVEVRVCEGRAENWKVTHPGDLERAEAILAPRGAEV